MKVGIIFNAFDLFYAGCAKMLEGTKQFYDYLIVGLYIAPTLDNIEKNKPIQTEVERYIKFRDYKLIDGKIIPYTTELYLENILRFFAVDFRIKEEVYKNKKKADKGDFEEKGIEFYYNRRYYRFSNSGLKKVIHKLEQLKYNKKISLNISFQ